MKAKTWYVYILKCQDETLYTGITTEVTRRVKEHNEAKIGAKYTKVRRPVQLIYHETYQSRSEAARREVEIKKLSRPEKQRLFHE